MIFQLIKCALDEDDRNLKKKKNQQFGENGNIYNMFNFRFLKDYSLKRKEDGEKVIVTFSPIHMTKLNNMNKMSRIYIAIPKN